MKRDWGTPPGIRKFTLQLKDAMKCGYNTIGDTEVVFPAQDYAMLSLFESNVKNFFHPSIAVLNPAPGLTLTGSAADYLVPISPVSSYTQLLTWKPIVMKYFVMNPTNTHICVDVEVWCWRKGWCPLIVDGENTTTLGRMYTESFGAGDHAVATAVLMQSNEQTVAVGAVPKIHAVDSLAVPSISQNAVKRGIDQIYHLPAVRKQRSLKMLSRRKCVAIRPGGIFSFKVVYRMPQNIPTSYLDTAPGYPTCPGMDRLVVIRWRTQTGTVTGALESSHMSEKVHIVVARSASISGTVRQRLPVVKAQLVFSHDGDLGTGTNYLGTAVTEHLAVQEVTKTSQNIETVP